MNERFFAHRALSLSIIVAIIVVSVDSPAWVRLFALAMIGWRSLAESLKWRPASKMFTTILGIGLFVQVFFEFRTVLGQEPATTLLVGLVSLKVLDFNGDRDRKVLILLGFILLALKPLFSLDLAWLPALFLCFAGLWASLLDPEETHATRYLGRLFLAALPTTLFLFFLFPRIIVPWAEGRGGPGSHVGFTDTLDPGAVADVAETNELVFRAHFVSPNQLVPANLYWRGAVLTDSQGLRWLPPRRRAPIEADSRVTGPSLHYQVLLEPNSLHYVFSLETPRSIRADDLTILRHPMGVFRLVNNVPKAVTYEGWSDLLDGPRDEPGAELTAVHELGPKTSALVEQIRAHAPTPDKKISAVREFFVEQKFQYTLHPDRYEKLEEFLFERRRGFCEHFAGSAATLFRALGLPARVVVGFQGGRYNPYGDFWRVTTRDAHAWVEVFVDGKWQRQDPTAWVAPLRPRLGGQDYFDLTDAERIEWSKRTGNGAVERQGVQAWVSSFSDFLENANYNWTNFLFEFDRASQAGLWEGIGEHLFVSLLVVVLAIVSVALLLRWAQAPRRRVGELTILLEDVFRWGSDRHLPRLPSETPRRYLERLATSDPRLGEFFERLITNYDLVVYGERAPAERPRELRSSWRRVRREKPRGKI